MYWHSLVYTYFIAVLYQLEFELTRKIGFDFTITCTIFTNELCFIFLYARLKTGRIVTGYGVRPSVSFFVTG